jgi:hypothetical protein
MTLPDERYRSIKWAQRLLEQLANPRGYTRIPSHVRKEAASVLRHFPTDWDLEQLARDCPNVLQEHIEPVTRMFLKYEQGKYSKEEQANAPTNLHDNGLLPGDESNPT